MPIAVKATAAGTLSFLHHDHLGSLVSASNASGTEIGSTRYAAYGTPRSGVGTNPSGLPSDRLFTGQIRDLGNDAFYFFKVRYYDATIGKFQTADSVVPGACNPQALNRYSYSVNNPLKYVDPTGHDFTYGSDVEPATIGGADFPNIDQLDPYAVVPFQPNGTSFIGSPSESWTNAGLGLVSGLVSLGQQPSLRTTPIFGKVAVPDHWEAIPERTALAKAARIGGIALGAAFTAADALDVVNRYNSGSLTSRPDRAVALGEDLLTVGLGGFAGIVLGASTAPLWVAIAGGLVIAGTVGGIRYEVERNDASLAGFGQGFVNTFDPLSAS
jgi:RHS repeat-associated protein